MTTPTESSQKEGQLEKKGNINMEADNAVVGDGRKRRLFGLIRRKDANDKNNNTTATISKSRGSIPTSAAVSIPSNPTATGYQGTSPPNHPTSPISPPLSGLTSPASPSPSRARRGVSPSPRLLSPASSLIFERDVQEPVPQLPADAEANIPTHFTTEDRIPPVLEASSIAIAENFDPDAVEILRSTAHFPATGAVQARSNSTSQQAPDALGLIEEGGMTASMQSSYGGLDTTDVRRLSFISFADVVQAEHAEHQQVSDYTIGRASSPPLSSGRDSAKSPTGLSGPGSPVGSSGPSEVVVTETMSQALRSAEISGGSTAVGEVSEKTG
jgi:hypothetical protein